MRCKNKPKRRPAFYLQLCTNSQCVLPSVCSSRDCREQCLPTRCGWNWTRNNVGRLHSPGPGIGMVLRNNDNSAEGHIMKLYTGKKVLRGLWKDHAMKCPGVMPVSYSLCPCSSLGREAGFLPPAVSNNQIRETVAPLYPSLPTCGLDSNPRLLPPGMNPKADSAIFPWVHF